MQPNKSELYQIKLLSQGTDSAMNEAGAAEAVEDRTGPVSECESDGSIIIANMVQSSNKLSWQCLNGCRGGFRGAAGGCL